MRYRLAVLAVPALLGGCATWSAPWSEVTGQRFNLAVADRRQVDLVSVGGRNAWASDPVLKVEPGRQRVVVASLQHAGSPGGRQQELVLDIEPCKRYYVNAQFENALSPRFEPVVDAVQGIAGCGTRKD
jgi:hypothetical protein